MSGLLRSLSLSPHRDTCDPMNPLTVTCRAMAASLAAQQASEAVEAISDNEELYTATRQISRVDIGLAEYQRQPRRYSASPSSKVTSSLDPEASSTIALASQSGRQIPPKTTGHLGIAVSDRAQMEKERLARQAARQQDASSAAAGSNNQAPSAVSSTSIAKENGQSSPAATSSMTAVPAVRPANGVKRSSNGVTHIGGPSVTANNSQRNGSARVANGLTGHPLQAPGPFPTDAAGEIFLEGEMRHTDLTIGEPTTARTFFPARVIGKVSLVAVESAKRPRRSRRSP